MICLHCGTSVKEGERHACTNPNHLFLDLGTKNDKEKLRYDLIPEPALRELARVYTIGASKYGERNWEKGLKWGRVFAAMMRHAWAWWGGEQCDPEDGQHHLSSVVWCAFALMTYENRKMGQDDRYQPPKSSE